MKRFTKFMLFMGAIVFGVTLLAAPHSGSHGTDILHYSVRKAMANDGVESNAVGNVQANRNEQGNADKQQLNVSVAGLTGDTIYQLLANGDTNLADGVSFTTDTNGSARLEYRKQNNGKGQGLGHGKTPLPAAFDPVSSVSQLDVFNATTQAVLTANMTMPDQLQYLIKRDISSNSVDASLRIHATTAQTQFNLTASGLAATNNYLLVVNGSVVQTETTDAEGGLKISSLPFSGSILTVNSLQLWDASSNVVLTTTLP
jgi:hypothetical protein